MNDSGVTWMVVDDSGVRGGLESVCQLTGVSCAFGCLRFPPLLLVPLGILLRSLCEVISSYTYATQCVQRLSKRRTAVLVTQGGDYLVGKYSKHGPTFYVWA